MKENKLKSINYSYFFNKDGLKSMYGEIYIMIFFLICLFILLNAVLTSDINMHKILGLNISYRYIIPFCIAVTGFLFLFYKFIKIYRKVVIDLSVDENKIIFNNLGFQREIKNFSIILLPSNRFVRWSNLEGFSRKYINYVGVEDQDGKQYIIPYAENMQDEVVNFLTERGGCLK
ncbi:hypothetical protein [Acinetobacter silvestris]|uniref:Uncharacterized protein n=1 Tax=Acinetobacter silvestris TaxID=1977882 RepID=A0A1Y3CIM0_9GAMM|nr:hypothetical protein [Acinetobacter silvestris]OTG66458.1 hypothetical protein B9T28_04185 [Acinetobacter silvestris]